MGLVLQLKHNNARKSAWSESKSSKKIHAKKQGDKKGGPHRRLQALMATVWTPFFIPLKIQQNFFWGFFIAMYLNN